MGSRQGAVPTSNADVQDACTIPAHAFPCMYRCHVKTVDLRNVSPTFWRHTSPSQIPTAACSSALQVQQGRSC